MSPSDAASERPFESGRPPGGPLLALAPMQDITDLPFWRLIAHYGGPDLYWTEYFRVHATSRLDREILRCIDENPTGRPCVAQLIGNDIPALVRSARELLNHPVAAIDINLGCPAPVVYRKCAGGGLLREPRLVDAILAALRETVNDGRTLFSVKTRIGFDSDGGFDLLLDVFRRNRPDLLTVHGRTVADMYRPGVRYDLIARAVQCLPCPVVANGDIDSPAKAMHVHRITGAHGFMIGRGAVRNPWLFSQVRDQFAQRTVRHPTGRQLLDYVTRLYDATAPLAVVERLQVEKMKKYMNFVGAGVGSDATTAAAFLHRIRRAASRDDFFGICREHLDHDEPMRLVDLPASAGCVKSED